MFANIWAGVQNILTLGTFGMMILGTLLRLVVGAMPGLTGTMANALVLPVTLYISPWLGIPLILAIYKSSSWSGAVSAILINTPGNAANAAMVIEGYTLCQQGKAGKALRASLYSGVTADMISDCITILVCAPIATIALMFGPPEFMYLIILAFLVIASVGEGNMLKSLISAALGVIVACIGYDPITSTARLMFKNANLGDGIQLVPLLIGAFALSEVFTRVIEERRRSQAVQVEIATQAAGNRDDERLSFKEFWRYKATLFRSALIGTGIGALPGIGASVSPWVSYSIAKRRTKHPEEYGNGSVEGLIACQAGCNAVSGANLIPLLTLGIPGDTVAAMLIGTLTVHGLQPGPLLLTNNPVSVYSIFATLIICNVIYFGLGFLSIRYAVKLTKIRSTLMTTFILALCVIGTYAYRSSMFDVGVMFVFGVIGYFMKVYGFSTAIFVIAFILGPTLELNLRLAMVLYDGNPLASLVRPISLVLFVLTMYFLFAPLLKAGWRLLKKRSTNTSLEDDA